jgi:uncharacterized membrane protein YkvA (DUF1232 family)
MLNPRRLLAFRALWRALRRGGAPGLAERARALPRMVGGALAGRYRGLSRARLALVVLGLVYLVSPVDLVPEALLPLIGLADDAVVVAWLAGQLLGETDDFLRWERERPRGARPGGEWSGRGRRAAGRPAAHDTVRGHVVR